jgi:hypothetical protein
MPSETNDPGTLPLVSHYTRILKAGEAEGSLESGEGSEPDLSPSGIRTRLDQTKAQLYQIIKDELGDALDLYAIADQIVDRGGEALRVVRDGDEEALRTRSSLLLDLETIVRTDGSRPSFMVRNGMADRATSPVGNWGDTLIPSEDLLRKSIECVGRIDTDEFPGGVGTGFLIQRDLILTNRHVLQAIATREDDGTWSLGLGAVIDFGREYRARESVNPRALRRVIFAGSRPILETGPADHMRLDLALIELEPGDPQLAPRSVLAVDIGPDWAQQDAVLYTIGYPGRPPTGTFTPTLLEQLFQTTFGCKRLAPGLVMSSPVPLGATWSMAHDATTLGGNSGSVVLIVGREFAAAGLHYGGRTQEPRANWGHILGAVLNETDGRSDKTLKDCLKEFDVQLIDRSVS